MLRRVRIFLLACAACACPAFAAPILDLSRSAIPAVLSDIADARSAKYNDQLIRLTNVGTDPLHIGSITIADGLSFALLGDCHGAIVAPGQGCSLIVRYVELSSFYATTKVIVVSDAEGSPHTIDVAGFSRFVAQQRSFPSAAPPYVDFGTAAVGGATAPSTITITNVGTGPDSTLSGVGVVGKHTGDFVVSGTCRDGTVLATGASCTFEATFVPSAPGPRAAEIRFFDGGIGAAVSLTLALVGSAAGAATAQAVEFYHAALDHYFLTHVASEIAILDAGVQIKGWARTGQSITVAASASATTSPVCRMYIPPALGDSHFYGRGTVECASTAQKNPSFVSEDPQFFHMTLPQAGVCPVGTAPVYRVFSNRPDANHRYMKDKTIRDEMAARNWLVEGDGPDQVVMCSPA